MTQAIAQRTFASGELTPALYPRVDLQKYGSGLSIARNFLIARHGGAYNRPGTAFVGEIKASATAGRLLPFIFNTSTGNVYVMEFGNLTLRFIQNGSYILEASFAISAISLGATTTVTAVGHNFVNGDQVSLSGIVGTTQLNNRIFIVAGVAGNNFNLQTLDSVNLNSTGYTAYVSGGAAARVYTIATPYAAADLPLVSYTQTADRVVFTHSSYQPQQLIRSGNTNWAMGAITNFNPNVLAPRTITGTRGAAGSITFLYKVTRIYTTGKESLAGTGNQKSIIGITQANPAIVQTGAAHNYLTGDTVYIDSVGGMVEINQREYSITVVDGTHFQLNGIDSTGYHAFAASGNELVGQTFTRITAAATPAAATPNVITWSGDGILSSGSSTNGPTLGYNIYTQGSNGSWGLIGSVSSATQTFNDVGLTPNAAFTPSNYTELFLFAGNYPAVCCLYQQRLVFAGSINNPTTVWTSQVGDLFNFSIHTPQIDSDAVTFTIPGRQVAPITHVQDFGQLIVYTQTAEYSAAGNVSGTLTPTGINLRSYSTNGSNALEPILVETTALYTQARGWQIRDLSFDLLQQGYHGDEVSIYNAHLMQGYTLVDWAYARIPNPTVYAVRSDGVLLAFTYIKAQQMNAWTRLDFTVYGGALKASGFVENVCVVPETTSITTPAGTQTVSEDAVYLIIRRTVSNRTVRYVERMSTRFVSDIRSCVYSDCSVTFNGTNTTATTVTLTGGTDWSYTNVLTATASAPTWANWAVGDGINLVGSDGATVRTVIQSISSGTVATVQPLGGPVPTSLRGVARSTWSHAVTKVGGLAHLAGQNVSILADGFVLANPNNPDYPVSAVSLSGTVTLPKQPFAIVTVGLPYTSDLQTLDIDTAQGETVSWKNKKIDAITLYVENSRGIWYGSKLPSTDFVGNGFGSPTGLVEGKFQLSPTPDQPLPLMTGQLPTINIPSQWSSLGRIALRVSDPVPCAITAVMPSGVIPLGKVA